MLVYVRNANIKKLSHSFLSEPQCLIFHISLDCS